MVTADLEYIRRANQTFGRASLSALKRWRSPARRKELWRLADKLNHVVDEALRRWTEK